MTLLIILIILALIYDFLNGFNDSSNIVATIIFSRALPPRVALMLVAVAEFAGPFLFGIAVARTIGENIANLEGLDIRVIVAALAGAIMWNLTTWYFSIPSSSSHSLVGGIIGAVAVAAGFGALKLQGVLLTLAALFLSPVLGLLGGFLMMRLIYFLAQNASLRINRFFKISQVFTGVVLALSHGANDAQKTIGMIMMGLIISGQLSGFDVPFWVLAAAAGGMMLGTSLGGWRLIRNLSRKYYKIRPVHGFSSQLTSGVIILLAALVGGPVSTTQVVSSTVLGVGAADRLNKVRWAVFGDIFLAWLLTIPVAAGLAALVYLVLSLFPG